MPKTHFAIAADRSDVVEADDGLHPVLNRLRLAAMACRVAARVDLFEACAVLTVSGEEAERTYVDTFVRGLPFARGRSVRWHRPGVRELSFDEAWVMRCLTSIESADEDSLSFLLRSRIKPAQRRYIGFLLGRIEATAAKS